jgi:hypothetical protein
MFARRSVSLTRSYAINRVGDTVIFLWLFGAPRLQKVTHNAWIAARTGPRLVESKCTVSHLKPLDLPTASFAGQQATFLNVVGARFVVSRVAIHSIGASLTLICFFSSQRS